MLMFTMSRNVNHGSSLPVRKRWTNMTDCYGGDVSCKAPVTYIIQPNPASFIQSLFKAGTINELMYCVVALNRVEG